MTGRLALLWLNKKIGEQRVMYLYAFLAIAYAATPFRTTTLMLSYSHSLQIGSNHLGRPIPPRKRHRRILHRPPPRTHVPNPRPPLRKDPPQVALRRLHWLDQWCRPSRGSGAAVLDWIVGG